MAGDRRLGFGSALVVVQVALSLMFVVAAGAFMRTFASLATLDLGFVRDPVLVASLSTTRLQLEPPDRTAFFARTLEAASAVPGVASASLSAVTPVSGSTWDNRIELPEPRRPPHPAAGRSHPAGDRARRRRRREGRGPPVASRAGAADDVPAVRAAAGIAVVDGRQRAGCRRCTSVAWLVGLGAVAGAAVSLWAARFVSTLLYGLEPGDPATLAGAILILAAVGALAGCLPARRASRIDPMRVLREP